MEELNKILDKYNTFENNIDKKINVICNNSPEDVKIVKETESTIKLTYEEAKKRNSSLLRDLEEIRGNLRSKAIFSPMEIQWELICQNYQECPALPVVTWRCHLPLFV